MNIADIRRKNALQPAGYWHEAVDWLCDRVEELENAPLALSREWRDVIRTLAETAEHDAAILPPDARMTLKRDIHPYYAGKIALLDYLKELADADMKRLGGG